MWRLMTSTRSYAAPTSLESSRGVVVPLFYDLFPMSLLRKVWDVVSPGDLGSILHLVPLSSARVRQRKRHCCADHLWGAHYHTWVPTPYLWRSHTVRHRSTTASPPDVDHIQGTAIYLAINEQDGKVAAVTRLSLYLVSPDIEFSRLTAERPP
ncbi:hypothetical protein EDC04DRAFT_242559 [Pisolithus marmoratus]|nr:hypothetical protein EDC04DRAFT_242559 [Pisolithus marmoratus]